MEEKIIKALLDMYLNEDFKDIANPDSAYAYKKEILRDYKIEAKTSGKREALDLALNAAISAGNSEGFVNGLRVGMHLMIH